MSKVQELNPAIEVVDRGPDWLFVRLQTTNKNYANLADEIWDLLHKHFIYRLVLEMDQVEFLPSALLGQLVILQKRILHSGGALRLCGLSSECNAAIQACRLGSALPNYENRSSAIYGSAHNKPR